MTGPSLAGVLGRKAGAAEGFLRYSAPSSAPASFGASRAWVRWSAVISTACCSCPSPAARCTLRRQIPDVGAQCVSFAPWDLCGERSAMRVPTAIRRHQPGPLQDGRILPLRDLCQADLVAGMAHPRRDLFGRAGRAGQCAVPPPFAAYWGDPTHVLDGLLYHESDLRSEEHYTDAAGFTGHLLAVMHCSVSALPRAFAI